MRASCIFQIVQIKVEKSLQFYQILIYLFEDLTSIEKYLFWPYCKRMLFTQFTMNSKTLCNFINKYSKLRKHYLYKYYYNLSIIIICILISQNIKYQTKDLIE